MNTSEFPHEVSIITRVITKSETYPFKETLQETVVPVKGFMDTPSTSERLTYHNMDKQLTRALYVPHSVQPKRTEIIMHDGKEYEIIGDVEDQGGQREVNRIPLKEVSP
ncbi:phage head-tail adapter protein [Salinicoccus roseus]|uniref:phage head-tail adapter protein n=1 Tax=Salinicoccus roseus TaxID=45670 RepID=UPI003561C3C9